MTKVVKRTNTNTSEHDKMIGDVLVGRGRHYEDVGNLPKARTEYKLALAYYDRALNNSDGYPVGFRGNLEKAVSTAKEYLREADKVHDLEKHSSHLPVWLRKLLRIKGMHVVGIFIFAILFSSPQITGSAIGSPNSSSFIGIILFLIGILCCYLLLVSKFYLRRARDQY